MTESCAETEAVRQACGDMLDDFYHRVTTQDSTADKLFDKEAHVAFLSIPSQGPLPKAFVKLSASQPWIIYWTLHSLDILGEMDSYLRKGTRRQDMISYLASCQWPTGGFGAGPDQLPHLAASYAAVASLLLLDALEVVDTTTYAAFLRATRVVGKGFKLQCDGEMDMRGTYCAVASADMLGILKDIDLETLPEYLQACQQYDGGISGDVGGESHAGYTYCALATMAILKKAQSHLNLLQLMEWLVHRQLDIEGGFNGRPNKLVDTCYTFWVAASIKICADNLDNLEVAHNQWVSKLGAQAYVLLCCQPIFRCMNEDGSLGRSGSGGLCDKPGKKPDWYHTCYGLSGLSVLQVRKGDVDKTDDDLFSMT